MQIQTQVFSNLLKKKTEKKKKISFNPHGPLKYLYLRITKLLFFWN